MNLRIVCLFLFLYSIAFAVPQVEFKNSCVPLKDFSDSQKEVLLKSYLAGEKFGYGYTLAAIAWKESCAGEYKMNFQDPSAGNFHAYIPGVIKRYPSLKQNGFTQNMVGALLVENDEFAAKIAISELQFWDKTHKGNWKNIIKSYNKGYSWQKNENSNVQAEKYYSDVAQRVKQLQGYFDTKEMKEIALKMPKKNMQNKEENKTYYAYNEDKKEEFMLLPIYQIGNEFAAPLKQKPTIMKDFELMEIY